MKRCVLFVLLEKLVFNMGIDNPGKNKYDLNNYCTVLAKEYPWAKKPGLNRLNWMLHRKQTNSKNRANARNRLGRKHLKVSRFSIRLLPSGSKEAMPVSRLGGVRGLKRAKYD